VLDYNPSSNILGRAIIPMAGSGSLMESSFQPSR
jgi:hypothetical protein